MVDEDSELEIEGLAYVHLLLLGEECLLQGAMSSRLTIEEIAPKSTPVDPVGGLLLAKKQTLTSPRQKWLVL